MYYLTRILSLIIFFAVGTVFQSRANTISGENINKESIEEILQYPDSIHIVAFGNSITATRKTINKVFAQRLPGLLLNSGIKTQVINSGIPGSHTGHQTDHNLFKIKHGLDRFEQDVLAYNPDLVIIGFGTNDAHIDSKIPEGKSRIPIDQYESNLEYMINQLLERNIKVILIAPNILGENTVNYRMTGCYNM